jgi:drug/metabolite transporter (DMT)-like permease
LPVELTGLIGFAAFNGAWVHLPGASAWTGMAYLTLISQFIGFYFYYKGLGLGGVAKMSQAQLLLPFLAIFASGLLLGEEIDGVVVAGAVLISGIVLVARWSLRERTVQSPGLCENLSVASETRPYRRRAQSIFG